MLSISYDYRHSAFTSNLMYYPRYVYCPWTSAAGYNKMEKDIASADKTVKKDLKSLAKTSAANKAGEIASVNADSGNDGGGSSNLGSQNGGEGSDEENEERGEVKNIMAELAKKTPEEVFAQFDTDGSGLIDFDEFRTMLPQLGIKISMPKVQLIQLLQVQNNE